MGEALWQFVSLVSLVAHEGAAESAGSSTAFGRRAAHGPWEDTGLGGERSSEDGDDIG